MTISTLITISNPRSPIAEAYRTLRTNLEFSNLDKSLRTILVTSASAEEGKSTTLANLAVTIAQSGKRVILVDADLRRPTQHQIFGLKNNAGLSDMVRDDAMLAQPPLQETGVQHLKVLTSGQLPPNPAEILGSKRMSEILAALLEHADLLLFDAPPLLAVTDAAVLSSKVDGVLLVVGAGKTKREHAKKAQTQLEKINARILGAVVNNVKAEKGAQYYYAESNQ
ncbi:MAG: CpsD/CapB family tyrosine-protein kinase [Chloroflexi bacterium]|nr:CpsD/CapB family tyrosine-protein kinase [Chloroflexota bacterium]